MGPTIAATSAESSDGTVNGAVKKKGIRRLLTPAIFTSGGDHKNKIAAVPANAVGGAPSTAPSAAVHHNRQNKTIIETAFVNNGNTLSINNNTTENAAYRTQQQQLHQQQQQQYVHYMRNRHANDIRSRSVSPGSFDRDVNANYSRRADSACSLVSSSSSAIPEYNILSSSSLSGRRSVPIIPYSQYYSNCKNGGNGPPQQRQQLPLTPVRAQVKITSPSATMESVYATAVARQQRQLQQQQQQQRTTVIYGNVPATAANNRRSPFVRGSPNRATIGCVRDSPSSRQSTIYETDEQDGVTVAGCGLANEKRFQPIFKRGSLQTTPTHVADGQANGSVAPTLPKRVSFSPQHTATRPQQPEHQRAEQPVYCWPTKKGQSPQLPTGYRATDSDRPLPSVPKRSPSTSAIYGTLRGTSNNHSSLQHQCCPSPSPMQQQHHHHYYHNQQSGSESGSEAGEVQRILNAKSNGLVVISKYHCY